MILQQIKDKPSRKRVGIISKGPPAREHTKIIENDQIIGEITSGCPSPSLGFNVAMGYVPLAKAKNGTTLQLQVRNKVIEATVSKMPFLPTNYFN